MSAIGFLMFAAALAIPGPRHDARAEDAIVGVNLVNEPDRQTVPDQEATLGALQAAGVRVIRTGLATGGQGAAFAARVNAHHIRIVWLLTLQYDGPSWLSKPQGYTGAWAFSPGLSTTDPDKFRAYFTALLGQLEDEGIVLAAFELGNEINWANADLTFPGQGRILGTNDLAADPEGQRVARGYLQYLKLLAVLKDVRDHSRLNRSTPIVSAGLADLDLAGAWLRSRHGEAVNADATLTFLRAHGLDTLVDGYGLHLYPPNKDPGTAEGAAVRLDQMRRNGLTQCEAAGSVTGKPCWITEWNFNGMNTGACPVDDTKRALLVGEARRTFARLAQEGRLKALLFYTWQGHIHAAKEDPESAFRCGALTESGRLAIAPLR